MKHILLIAGVGLVGYYLWNKYKKPCSCHGGSDSTATPAVTVGDHATPPMSSATAQLPLTPPGTMMYDAREVGGVFPAQTTISTVSDNHLANLTLN